MQGKILVVGLGNPGQRYANSRHNFGFMVLDEVKDLVGASGWQKKFQGLYCNGTLDNRRLNLLKPMTFMNLSGESVLEVVNYYRIEVDNLILVHDDLDLPFGSLRIKKGGGTGGHKGVASVVEELGESDFVRVRMGVGRPVSDEDTNTTDATDYVLGKFSTEENKRLINVIDRGVKALECVVHQGVTKAMNAFNKRGGVTNES